MSNIPDITYILSRGNETYRFLKNFFAVGYIWNQYIKEKYYKGTESILYFPYINHDLKKCHAVKISTTYYGTTAGKLYVDGFITANDIFDKVKIAKEYYGNFNYEAHKEIEEYNKNLPDPRLFGEYVLDDSPLPDWTKENDPNLSGKLNGIDVKNW